MKTPLNLFTVLLLSAAYPVMADDAGQSSTTVSPAEKTASTLLQSVDPTAANPLPFPAVADELPATAENSDEKIQDMRDQLLTSETGLAEKKRFPDATFNAPATATQQRTAQSSRSGGGGAGTGQQQPAMMSLIDAVKQRVSPLPPEAVRDIAKDRDRMSASINAPVINAVPHISSQTISLSAGSEMPVVRVAPGRLTYIVFEDITGAPWPLAEKVVNSAGEKKFFVSSYENTPIVTVQPLVNYGNGDLGILLKDLNVPVTVVLANTEPEAVRDAYPYDSRINLRIPRRGPLAPKHTINSVNKIALSSPELQSLLDGIAPPDAVRLKTDNKDVAAWKRADKLYLRTQLESRSQFTKMLSSSDGTHVYEMEITPFVSMMQNSSTITVKVEL